MNHFPLTRVPSVEIVFLTPVRNVDVSEVFPLQLPSAQGKGCQGCHGHQSSGRWCYCISAIRALIVSLFNRSELDCLFVSLAGAWPPDGGTGEGGASAIIYFTGNQNSSVPCLAGGDGGGDCSKTYNYICCRHYFCQSQ